MEIVVAYIIIIFVLTVSTVLSYKAKTHIKTKIKNKVKSKLENE